MFDIGSFVAGPIRHSRHELEGEHDVKKRAPQSEIFRVVRHR